MTTPAGWYPDPDGSSGQRYFDGQSWTEHRAAPAVEAPPLEAAAAAPRTSGPNGKVIAGVIAAVVVLVVVGVAAVMMTLKTDVGDATVTRTPSDASDDTSVVPDEPETGVEAPTLENQAWSVGQPVRDGNFEFVVTGIDRGSVVADPEFPDLQKAAAGEYVFVNMKVTNVGTEPQTFFASFNTLSDGTTEFTSDDEAWIYLGNTLADLNPGDSIDTAVVFDVPVGTDPESIELHDGPFSDGVTVGL
jgi:Domain of unknown function (DUF4352)/Protein of unknown function (DUF2510)